MKKMVPLLVSAIFLLSSCNAPSGDIEAHSAWVRPTAKGENAAVYLTLHNHSANDDALTGATTNVADVVEIHESKVENDVMQMNMIDSLPIAADEEIIFKPGGFHVMLVDIKEDLVQGEHIGLILHFKNHEDVVVDVHIENSMPDEDHESNEEH
jgi:copper(I)-binding protein